MQTRAAAPRTNGAGAVAHAAPEAHAATVEVEAYAPPPGPSPSPPPVEVAYEEERTQMNAVPTSPPVSAADDEVTQFATDEAGTDLDVEVSTEVVEVDIDIDEPIAAESGQQPVAHATEPPPELEVVEEDVPVHTQPSGASEELAAVDAASPPANEIEEPAPSSSPRPIEQAAAEAYEEESSPRHTPPPESGKQVAVAPSAHPAARKSSVPPPPPSLEGHTLIGGWREPGLAAPGGAGAQVQVRVPAPAQQAPEQPTPPAAAPLASGTRLTADVTRADLPVGAKVAMIEGAAPVPKPATMGDLLDLTLGL